MRIFCLMRRRKLDGRWRGDNMPEENGELTITGCSGECICIKTYTCGGL